MARSPGRRRRQHDRVVIGRGLVIAAPRERKRGDEDGGNG
jgi:hypothetical protein